MTVKTVIDEIVGLTFPISFTIYVRQQPIPYKNSFFIGHLIYSCFLTANVLGSLALSSNSALNYTF